MSAMPPREIIRRCVAFDAPERIGLTFTGQARINDVAGGGILQPHGWTADARVEGNMDVYQDEWGNTWHRIRGMSQGGEVRDPAIKDWRDLDRVTLPNYKDPARYDSARNSFAAHPDKYPLGSLPGFPFAIMRYMRKMEVFLEDVLVNRDHVEELQRRVVAVLKDAIDGLAGAGADAVFFCEDWGTQDRLLVDPALWRSLFRPGFEELVSAAAARGMNVWMHSCGCVESIIEDLIGVGIKVLQFDQPALYGSDHLAGRYRGRVAFWCPVDIQKTMQSGDRDVIRAEAKHMCRALAAFQGGFIAKNYGDLHGIGVDPQWDQWAYEAFVESGG